MAKANKWNEQIAERAISLAKRGLKDREIARELAISPTTFSRWRSAHHEFKKALHDARAPLSGARRVLAQMRISPNSARGQKLLEQFVSAQRPERVEVRKIWRAEPNCEKLSAEDLKMAEELMSDSRAIVETYFLELAELSEVAG